MISRDLMYPKEGRGKPINRNNIFPIHFVSNHQKERALNWVGQAVRKDE